MINKAAAKKLENVFIKAEDKGKLPKGFSPYDFDELCRAYHIIEEATYFDTINNNVAELFRKCGYVIIDWSEPWYADKMKIGYRICNASMHNRIVIGIDESYKRTGISIVVDGEIKSINSIDFHEIKTNSEKRKMLREKLNSLIIKLKPKADEIIIIVERIRLHSAGFISEDYIKSIGALIAVIVDTAYEYGISVYSVDTRAWKSKIVGTTKPENNNLFVDPKKYPTIKYLIKKGYEEKIKVYLPENTKIKNYLEDDNGRKFLYNDDAADSACIALYGTLKDGILKEEK